MERKIGRKGDRESDMGRRRERWRVIWGEGERGGYKEREREIK